MPEIQITDTADVPVPSIKVDLTHPSAWLKYLKTELLHLAVFPNFLERKDEPISQAATPPIQFKGQAKHAFQLGNTVPEISFTPEAQFTVSANATAGSNVLESDPFHVPATVPANTAYLGVTFEGSLDLAVSGSDGDLSFGFDQSSSIRIGYQKAFPVGQGEPAMGEALGETLSAFVIPADLADLKQLDVNDIATVSGTGSLKVSGAVNVTAVPNHLASPKLPLGAGVTVNAGATAGLSASFTIKGSYQIRTRCKNSTTIELSVLKRRDTTLKANFSASAGVTATVGGHDLIPVLLGAISTDPMKDKHLLEGLTPAEANSLTQAIQDGLDHSVQASINETLTDLTDDQAVFQYEIQPDRLNVEGINAVHKALDGDFELLTTLESDARDDGALAPGIKLLNSVLTTTRKRGATFKLNLLGILNFTSVGELIRNSEIITDGTTGDVTIKETVSGERISAITNNAARDEALRKALFDSVLVTTTYRAGRAMPMPSMECEHLHFAANQNTNSHIWSDYVRWLVALNLLAKEKGDNALDKFHDSGPSSCILRTRFADVDCTALFLQNEQPRSREQYLEIGRQALRALLDREQPMDALRYRIVDDALWPKALATGANVNLGGLVGLSTADSRVKVLIGDLVLITSWADSMSKIGALVQDLRKFVADAGGDPARLVHDNSFKKKRDQLQQTLAGVIQASKTRFDEPWGMVALFWAAGSPRTSSGKIITAQGTEQWQADRAKTLSA